MQQNSHSSGQDKVYSPSRTIDNEILIKTSTSAQYKTNGGQDTEEDIIEARRRGEENRRALKGIQSYYTEKRAFTGNFQSNLFVHLENYVDLCADWNVQDGDKVSFFHVFASQ